MATTNIHLPYNSNSALGQSCDMQSKLDAAFHHLPLVSRGLRLRLVLPCPASKFIIGHERIWEEEELTGGKRKTMGEI